MSNYGTLSLLVNSLAIVLAVILATAPRARAVAIALVLSQISGLFVGWDQQRRQDLKDDARDQRIIAIAQAVGAEHGSIESGIAMLKQVTPEDKRIAGAIAVIEAAVRDIKQNLPPQIECGGQFEGDVGDPLEFVCLVTDADGSPDDGGRRITLSHQLPSGASYDQWSGLFSWTPTKAGEYHAYFAASDGLATSSRDVTITVRE